MSHAHLSRIVCVSLLTGRHIRAQMHTANAATVSRLACEPVGMALLAAPFEGRFTTIVLSNYYFYILVGRLASFLSYQINTFSF